MARHTAEEEAKELAKHVDGYGIITERQLLAYLLKDVYLEDRERAADLMGITKKSVDAKAKTARSKLSAMQILGTRIPNSGSEMRLFVDEDSGSELAEYIARMDGSRIFCFDCSETHVIGDEVELLGNPHRDGQTDAQGRTWWTYVKCPKTGYQMSWKYLDGNIVTEDEVVPVEYRLRTDPDSDSVIFELRHGLTHDSLGQSTFTYYNDVEVVDESGMWIPDTLYVPDRDINQVIPFIGGTADGRAIATEIEHGGAKVFERTFERSHFTADS